MTELFSLGDMYVSDFLKDGEDPRGGKVEMKLMLDNYGAVRLDKFADQETMYGKYWYRSGINKTMRDELRNIVESITSVYKTKAHDIWLDIACNDGTLLGYVPDYMYKIGIDPADDSFVEESSKAANLLIQDFFSAKTYNESHVERASVVTSIAVFYDIPEREKFLRDVYDVMDDNGLWVMQLSYTPLMLKQLAFDNICHEHYYYYSLFNLKRLLNDNGFKIVDCQLNDINGGSFRVYVMKDKGDVTLFGSQPYRDVCDFRVNSLLNYERELQLDDPQTWMNFFSSINELKQQTVSFIKDVVGKGGIVMGYGASTKGNTLLQYFGIDNTLLTAIVERSHYKFELRTVGTNIPIISEEEMRTLRPDYLLVLPWHFINEFIERESDFLKGGGKFIVPCPKFKIIG